MNTTVRLGLLVAFVVAAVSIANLTIPDLYGRETENWRLQAIVQDWIDLAVLAPLLLTSSLALQRGSRPAAFVLVGALMFTAYSFVIFAFAMHFNQMFIAYCATLGLSGLALIKACMLLGRSDAHSWFSDSTPTRFVGGLLAGIGVLFLGLWLAGDVPPILANDAPKELAEVGLPVNPVHALDYSAVLPLHITSGIALWRRRPFGFASAPAIYTFGLVTDLAILAIMLADHEPGDPWTPVAIVAAITVLAGTALALLLSKLRKQDPTNA